MCRFCGWFCVIYASMMLMNGCDCGGDILQRGTVEVRFRDPSSGLVVGKTPVEIDVSPRDEIHFVQVRLTSQGGTRPTQLIAEMHDFPFRFQWNTLNVSDGFYVLQAFAYGSARYEHSSSKLFVQVSNEPPRIWFANCQDGQFIRGTYSLIVNDDPLTVLRSSPLLFVNGQPGGKTLDRFGPYRYALPTETFGEGDQLEVMAEGEDTLGNRRQISCFPRVDNTPPTLVFRHPSEEDVLLGKEFIAAFQAWDRFGVREIRLWVDGTPCQMSGDDEPDVGDKESCPPGFEMRRSRKSPNFEIDVRLSDEYKSVQPIVLTARSIDLAGNISDPPTKIRVRIDPIPPEIFIRSPGKGEMFETSAEFTARVVDNHSIEQVRFYVESEGKRHHLGERMPSDAEATFRVYVEDMKARFGFGRKVFVVQVFDLSGNMNEESRPFVVGCVDSSDCDRGKVCHHSQCLIPADLNQRCGSDRPCAIGIDCVPGHEPICRSSQQTYCRKRCNPGNKFVSSEECPEGFFCDRERRVCMPGDGCRPLSNDCGQGWQCSLKDDDAGICVPVGSVRSGNSCEQSCTASNNCVRDHWCIHLISIRRTACLRVCDVGAPNCQKGQSCHPLQWSFGGDRLRWGVCQ